MKKLIIPAAALFALSACGGASEASDEVAAAAAEEIAAGADDASTAEASANAGPSKPGADAASGSAATAAPAVDFGDDSSDWANDGECDDPRFEGSGMTATNLLVEDIAHDATDCREAYEAGNLEMRD